jgi:uncharacterized glyoxalase superfamily protein PhnB
MTTPNAPSPDPARADEPENLGTHNGFEIYPMPMFITLRVTDPADVASWYERALGFASVFRGPVIHLRRRKYQDILIVGATDQAPPTSGGPRLSFHADGEVDAIAARAASVPACGSSRVHAPIDTPWNAREVTIIDPAAHVLVFTSRRATPDPVLDASWRAMFEQGRHGDGDGNS